MPTPTPTPTTYTQPTVTYTGVLSEFSGERQAGFDASLHLFDVAGSGLLLVDVTGVDLSEIRAGSARLSLQVPAGLTLSADSAERFTQLMDHATSVAPLTVLTATPGKILNLGGTSALVNQTPNTPAVHQVYAVLVTPSNGAQDLTNQTSASVGSAITHTSNYWSNQSDGTITFDLAGTTTWYKSANACSTQAGVTALWNEAAGVAVTQLGYTAAKNTHLVLFFPAATSCGSAIGMATVGASVNQGGRVWVLGSGSAIARQTTSHELGHNLSLGHANWALCTAADPHPGYVGTTGCTIRPYGDVTDVMGYGISGKDGGALSSPQAIRASIWPASAWTSAPAGTSTHTLNTVTAHGGLRAIVVQDSDGVNYFVEFRNFTAEDFQYSGFGCNTTVGACVASAPSVRILRLSSSGYQGLPGDDSHVISRSSTVIGYTAGQSFHSQVSGGITVTVNSINSGAGTASVSVTRGVNAVLVPDAGGEPDFFDLGQTVGYDNAMRVGDTWTGFFGDWWAGDSYSFQWYRNGSPIPGAVSQNYVLTSADFGAFLDVYMVVTTNGASQGVWAGPDYTQPYGYGPVQAPGYAPTDPGSISVTNATSTLQAVESGWPVGTTFTRKWVRETTAPFMAAVAGATGSTYTLTVADRDKDIAVQVTAIVPYPGGGNYPPVMRQSAAKDYSITYETIGGVSVVGTPKVGVPLTVTNTNGYKTADGAISPDFTYTWFRNGVAIPGASGPALSTYTPVAADYNTKLSVRVDASQAGYVALTGIPSPLTAFVVKGDIAITANPTITIGATQLQASAVGASTSELGVAGAYQWFRGATLIAGATGQNYTPGVADYGQFLKVRLTITKLNYNTQIVDSAIGNYSLYPIGAIGISGTAQVGQTLSIPDISYQDSLGNPLTAVRTYQWFRNGVAIAGATNAGYQLLSADYNLPITVKVTAKSGPWVPITLTAPPTPLVTKGAFAGTLAADVTLGAAFKLTATPSGVTALSGVITYGYQWFRKVGTAAPVAIAGATLSTYTLGAADFNTFTFVRITATNPNYLTVTADSAPHGYSVVPTPLIPVIVGEQRIGVDLSIGSTTFTLDGGPVFPNVTYSWFRDGVAIPGTTGAGSTFAHYTPSAADSGKAITVKMTASFGGNQPSVATSLPTQKLTAYSIPGFDSALPAVVQDPGTLKLTLPGTGFSDPSVVIAYQWLRSGVAIPGAIASTYTMTAADFGKVVSVRVTASKPLYTTVVKVSPGIDYSIYTADPLNPPYVSTTSDNWQVGATANVFGAAFTTKDGPLAGHTLTYQWLRNGVAIPGATNPSYLIAAADFNTKTSVRLTASKPGYLSGSVASTQQLVITANFATTSSFATPTVSVGATGLLTAVIAPGTITDPSPTYSYAWLRDGAATVGTAATFQLTAADWGHTVSLRVTVSKVFYTSTILPTTPAVNYSVTQDAPPTVVDTTLAGAFRVGDVLAPTVPNYTAGGNPVSSPTFSYQWFKKVAAAAPVAIVGAPGTGATYTIQSADFGATLSVRVTAGAPGFVSLVSTTAQTSPASIKGVITGSQDPPTVVASPTGLLSVVLTPGSIDMPSPTLAYQWFRVGSPADVLLATTPTYQLTAANYTHQIYVKVTASKANATPATFPLDASDVREYGIITNSGAAITMPGATPRVGDQLGVTPPPYVDPYGNPLSPTFTYQWYRKAGAAARIAIAGATQSTYTLVAGDYGSGTTAIIVDIKPTVPGLIGQILASGQTMPVGQGIIAGSLGAPTVAVTGPAQLTASLPVGTVTTTGTTLAHKWYRDGVVVAGQVAATYTLTAADYDKDLSVGVIVSKPGFVSRDLGQSAATDCSLKRDVALGLFGTASTGQILAANASAFSDALANPVVSATVAYQWFRKVGAAAPVAIAGATQPTYELTSADLNTVITLRVTATAPGMVTYVVTSPPTALVTKGSLQGSFSGASVVPNGNGGVKVDLPAGYVTTTGTTITYQWLRDGVVIPAATASSYVLGALDQPAAISVRVKVAKLNLDPVAGEVRDSSPRLVAITPNDPLSAISGDAKVGSTLTVDPGTYTNAEGALSTVNIQWMRKIGAAAAVNIAGATATTYVLTPTDLGATTTIIARVTPVAPGSIGTARTVQTGPPIAPGDFAGTFVAPTVTLNPATNTLTGSLTAGSVTTSSPVISYQWKRNGVNIAGATTATYKLTALDVAPITLKVVVSRPGFNPAPSIPESAPVDYFLRAESTPESITGDAKVGRVLTVGGGTYMDASSNPVVPVRTYAWFRKVGAAAPVLIAGATASTYTVAAGDLNAVIIGRVTVAAPGFVGFVGPLTAPTATIAKGDFQGSLGAPVATMTPATNTLTATLPAGTITDPAPTLSYQWFRGAAPIVGATLATYKLVAADWGSTIKVRVTVKKLNFNDLTLPDSTANDYSIVANSALSLNGAQQVGWALSLNSVTWTSNGSPVTPAISYQWFRQTGTAAPVAIAGATAATYLLQFADLGKTISLRLTTSSPGAIGKTETTSSTGVIVGGVFSGSFAAPIVVEDNPTMTLSASLAAGSVNETGLTIAYQWLRDGAPIAGATTATYKLVEAADRNKEITVRITFSKPGYAAHAPLVSNSATYTLGAAWLREITGPNTPPQNGDTLQLTGTVYDYTPSSVTYQWFRKTGAAAPVAIVGNLGTGSTYTVIPADVGTVISVQITAAYPGYFSNIQTPVTLPVDP